MELIKGQRNQTPLKDLNRRALDSCEALGEAVDAAVAYVTDENTLLDGCWKRGIKLQLWARYDYSCPVRLDILKRFLNRKSANYQIRLVPDIFHTKAIWWHGFGAYIGSANLSQSAWSGNFEAGVFFTEEELDEQSLSDPLLEMFEEIDAASHPLTEEVLTNLEAFSKQEKFGEAAESARKAFLKTDRLPPLESLLAVDQRPVILRRKQALLKEWSETLAIMKGPIDRVATNEFRPKWVKPDVPSGCQIDRFLHAYYLNTVKEGQRSKHIELHQENRSRPEGALEEAMIWWSRTENATWNEDIVLHEWAPTLRRLLEKDSLRRMTEDQFVDLCSRIHAIRDYALRVSYTVYGLFEKQPHKSFEERVNYHAHWLYQQRNQRGESPMELIAHVLYGGPTKNTPSRMFDACNDPERHLRGFGISTFGEIVGWAMPDEFPPRNGRTSKALKALGFKVRVHSEESHL